MNKDVVSLEIAKELERAGRKEQPSDWWWVHKVGHDWELKAPEYFEIEPIRNNYPHVPAPTTTQLANELPAFTSIRNVGKLTDKNSHWWEIIYGGVGRNEKELYSESLPDALGLCLIYLIKNGLIDK